MNEAHLGRKVDRYFRSDNTVPARLARRVSPQYDIYKENAERVAAVPLAIAATPIIGVTILARVIEDPQREIFHKPKRVAKDGSLFIMPKISTMPEDAHLHEHEVFNAISVGGDDADPRITKLGRFFRKHDLDDLPQIFQVVTGKLSLMGIRAHSENSFDKAKKAYPEKYDKWRQAYFKRKPSFLNVASILLTDKNRKNVRMRAKLETFYDDHASLGFDLYLYYRALRKGVRRALGDKNA